jgi:formylglycine-generating enzyme
LITTSSVHRYPVTYADAGVLPVGYAWEDIPEDHRIDPETGKPHGKSALVSWSWIDAVRYCNRKSADEGLTPCYSISSIAGYRDEVTWDRSASGYRLPTEKEWENAALSRPRRILFFRHQQVWEWCWDVYDEMGAGVIRRVVKRLGPSGPERYWFHENATVDMIGFRLARSV